MVLVHEHKRGALDGLANSQPLTDSLRQHCLAAPQFTLEQQHIARLQQPADASA
jgi:hypothetical protein